MAPIPKKDKNNLFNTQTLNFNVVFTILIIMLTVMLMFQGYVHKKYQIYAMPYFIIVGLLLLFPSPFNKGKNGIQTLLLVIKNIYVKAREKGGLKK